MPLDETSETLPDYLRGALEDHTPRYCRPGELAPPHTYGRHRGPAPPSAREAAVLILLFRRENRWWLPLIQRTDVGGHHRGQISLPGGLLETGETSEEAAMRECAEELGPQPGIESLGQLANCYIFASDSDVSVWLAATHEPPAWQPNLAEVERVIELPLLMLDDPTAIGEISLREGSLKLTAPCYCVGEDQVWGATAVMLSELAQLIKQANSE